MRNLSIQNMVLLVLMLASAALGTAMRPTISLADERPPMNLETMIPRAFGDWREEMNGAMQVVNPQSQSMIRKLYSQTIGRTYVDSQGYRIMLSIAYGKNQNDAMQLHKPEICYPAQGFVLLGKRTTHIDLSGQSVVATRLETRWMQRFEPVTYWTVVGDHNVTSVTDKKIIEMRYALNHRIPDGILVRVSSIDDVADRAYVMQGQFASAMMASIAPEHRLRFAGQSHVQYVH